MSCYITRIELHGAENDKNAYDTLHKAMQAAGFRRYGTFSGGDYWLPTAEYMSETNTGACIQVRDAADRAAKTAGFSHSSLVCEIYSSQYCGTTLTKK